MPLFNVRWETTAKHWTNIEAESEKEALEIAMTGRHEDEDSEPGDIPKNFRVSPGCGGPGRITKCK